jgi:hypothetical protein
MDSSDPMSPTADFCNAVTAGAETKAVGLGVDIDALAVSAMSLFFSLGLVMMAFFKICYGYWLRFASATVSSVTVRGLFNIGGGPLHGSARNPQDVILSGAKFRGKTFHYFLCRPESVGPAKFQQ